MKKLTEQLVPLYLSKEKFEECIRELDTIGSQILPEIRNRMAIAYEDGDIPENNPFLTANDDLQKAFKRRNELREIIARAKLYKGHKERHIIHLGSSFSVEINGTTRTITLVSSEEADPANGKISIDSPIGKALLGHLPGEIINVTTPSGIMHIRICNCI